MTEAQRALVLSIYDAIGNRDLDELRRLGGPDSGFEWASASDEVDAGTRHGTEAAIACASSPMWRRRGARRWRA